MSNDAGDVLLAFLVGALSGTVFGLLYAPRPGRETRERLKVLSDEISEKIKAMSEDMKEHAGDVVDEARDRYDDAKEKLMAQKEKIEELIEGKKPHHNKHQG